MYVPLLRLSLEIHISCRTIVHQAHSVYRSTLGIEKIVREGGRTGRDEEMGGRKKRETGRRDRGQKKGRVV